MAPVILLVQVLDSHFTPKLPNPLENSRSGGEVISSELLSVGFMNTYSEVRDQFDFYETKAKAHGLCEENYSDIG